MKHHTIGFIGAGNMARSLAGGLLNNAWSRDRLILSDPNPEQRTAVADSLGLRVYEQNTDVAARADVLVLAVKPQILRATALDLAASVQAKKPLVVSIAARSTPAASATTAHAENKAPARTTRLRVENMRSPL